MAKNVLGKGLGALIPEISEEMAGEEGQRVIQLSPSEISPNPYQPRLEFSTESIEDLRRSIDEKGVIQPILVRRFGGGYQLIAGERRLRAAKLAGLGTIPCIVTEASSPEELMELSLVENIQREDLNPIEEAKAYRALMDQCYMTHEDVSHKVGKDRSTVSNLLRLLRLPAEVQQRLSDGTITMGHARALLSVEDERLQSGLCRRIVKEDLSVRRVEQLVRSQSRSLKGKGQDRTSLDKDPNLLQIQDEVRRLFGTAVRIVRGGRKGTIQIEFYGDEDLERIVGLLRKAK